MLYLVEQKRRAELIAALRLAIKRAGADLSLEFVEEQVFDDACFTGVHGGKTFIGVAVHEPDLKRPLYDLIEKSEAVYDTRLFQYKKYRGEKPIELDLNLRSYEWIYLDRIAEQFKA